MKRMTTVAALVACAELLGGSPTGLPEKFTYSVSPFRGGTAYYLDASHSRLYMDGGKPTCSYLGDLVFPAWYDGRLDAHYCPDVTIRHVASVEPRRFNGKCLGMVCGYDIAVPGGGYMLTTDLVDRCPDIIVTVYRDGRMSVVAAKNFRPDEDASPYFRNGKLIDLHFITEPVLVDKCGGGMYRRQLDYWLGPSLREGDRNERVSIEYDGWDGT